MEKCKLKRLTLKELAEVMPIVEKQEQEESFGGYDLPEVVIYPTSNTQREYVANLANSYRGILHELSQWSIIQSMFAGTGITPSSTPGGTNWCAAFVNYIFDYAGIGAYGYGGATVSNWHTFGSSTTNPKVGDVAIWKPGTNNTSHMGIVTGVSGDYVIVTSGNYSDNVGSTNMVHKNSFDFRTY